MYPAVVERDDVFPPAIRIHAVSSQGERDELFTQEFVKDLLSVCDLLFYHNETSQI